MTEPTIEEMMMDMKDEAINRFPVSSNAKFWDLYEYVKSLQADNERMRKALESILERSAKCARNDTMNSDYFMSVIESYAREGLGKDAQDD